MHRGASRDDAGVFDAAWFAAEVRDDTACFADEQDARGNIPRRELKFPERLEPPARHVGQVERRGARRGGGRRMLGMMRGSIAEIAVDRARRP